MIDIEKKKRLIAISLQAKAYADVYKYASEVIEADPDDGYAWAMKGVAAANTFDINASKINELIGKIQKEKSPENTGDLKDAPTEDTANG